MKKFFIMMLATATLSSCHIYKKYERPDNITTDNITREVAISQDTTGIGDLPWKEVFTDPKLQALIETGLQNNLDLQQVLLKIEQAEAGLKMARRSFAPSVAFNPQGSISYINAGDKVKAITPAMGISLPYTSKSYQVPLAVSWEIDIFGKLLNSKRLAKTRLQQTEAYAQATRAGVISGIANYYITLISLDKQLAISEETSQYWDKSVETMKAMKEAAFVNETAIVQSEAQAAYIKAQILDLKRGIHELENALCLFLNIPAQTIDRSSIDELVLPDLSNITIPITMLANRPDVQAAELELAAAYYNTNIARASFYPSLSISGTGAWLNNALGSVINPGQLLLSAAGSLLMPIFAQGKLQAQLKVAKSQEEEVRLAFQHTIYKAGCEVSDALFTLNTAKERKIFRDQQVERYERSVEYTNDLLLLGSSTYLEVLTAQQSLLSSQLAAEKDRLETWQAYIGLYLALGGGKN